MLFRNFSIVMLGFSLLPILGCGGSSAHVDQAKDEGYIRFENVTALHQIYLDGKKVGTGNDLGNLQEKYPLSDSSTDREDYIEESPDQVLAVTPGTHVIEIMENNKLLLKRKIFIGTNSTKTISVN